MQQREAYMKIAIQAAMDSSKNGGVAIGAVLVDAATGEVVATGGSQVRISKDPTAHAEITAIRTAAKLRSTDDLSGLILFSTLEPCHMCLSAAAWARVPQIFFGAYRKNVDETLFDIKGDFSDEQEGKRMNLRENLTMKVSGGVLEAECAELLATYHEPPKHAFKIA